jgi:integrase-like protein
LGGRNDCSPQARTPRSGFKRRASLERYAKPLRSFPVAEFTDPMVGRLIEHVVVERESIDTARKLRQSLAGIFRYAMARGFCTHNPAESSRELIPRPSSWSSTITSTPARSSARMTAAHDCPSQLWELDEYFRAARTLRED